MKAAFMLGVAPIGGSSFHIFFRIADQKLNCNVQKICTMGEIRHLDEMP